MDPARWQRVQSLFHEALDRPEGERQAFVETAADGDPGLAADVLRMLEEDARAAPLLDDGVSEAAAGVLASGPPGAGDTEAPRRLGPYVVKERLGEGGMGVVWLAERVDVGQRVAIKVLRDAWVSPARRERFAAEQRTLAQLEHPLIARLYDADALPDGTPWFAMEYVDGVPLTDYCRRHGTSIPERLQLFRGVCEAVLHAHRHAVIHRDLKPSNILVREDGSVRLLDFGIAKQLESLDAPADQTRTGLRMMTPAYASPEQRRGERVGIATDVYSLGVVLYELLTGGLPFSSGAPDGAPPDAPLDAPSGAQAQKPSEAARRLADALPPGRERLRPGRGAWADLDVLCLTAMHPDPARRYASVEALIRDLERFAKNEPLEARPDSFVYRARKFVARNRGEVLAVAAGALVVATLLTFNSYRLASARNAAMAEAARTQRVQRFMLDLFEGGDHEAGPAERLRVVDLLERGVRTAGALDAEPAVQAEMLMTLGSVYQKLGDLDQAEGLLTSALEREQAMHAGDHPAVADALVAMGLLRYAQARLDEAEPLVRDGLDMACRANPAGHPACGRAHVALGKVLQDRGDYDGAIAVLERAVERLSGPDASEGDLAAAVTELANTHFYAGHYDESEALNRRALDIDRRLRGERHPSVADSLINLGAIQFQRGLYAEAEAYDRRALDILEEWYGPDHPETASALTVLGRAVSYQERPDEAGALLERALAVQERVYGPVHPRVASAVNDLAILALGREDYDAAEAQFRRMASIYRQVYGDRHALVATALSNIASVHLNRGDYAAAEPAFRDVVARYTAAVSPDDLNTGIARIKLGRALLRQEKFAEAVEESLAGYRIVEKLVEPGSGWLRAAREDLVKGYEGQGLVEAAGPWRPAAAQATEPIAGGS